MIGSPFRRSKRDRDIIAIAGTNWLSGVPEAGVEAIIPTIITQHLKAAQTAAEKEKNGPYR